MNSLPKCLALIMVKNDTDQLHFARQTGVDRGWLSKVLNGKARFGARAVSRLSASLEPADAVRLLQAYLVDEISLIETGLQPPQRGAKSSKGATGRAALLAETRSLMGDLKAKLDPFNADWSDSVVSTGSATASAKR